MPPCNHLRFLCVHVHLRLISSGYINPSTARTQPLRPNPRLAHALRRRILPPPRPSRCRRPPFLSSPLRRHELHPRVRKVLMKPLWGSYACRWPFPVRPRSLELCLAAELRTTAAATKPTPSTPKSSLPQAPLAPGQTPAQSCARRLVFELLRRVAAACRRFHQRRRAIDLLNRPI